MIIPFKSYLFKTNFALNVCGLFLLMISLYFVSNQYKNQILLPYLQLIQIILSLIMSGICLFFNLKLVSKKILNPNYFKIISFLLGALLILIFIKVVSAFLFLLNYKIFNQNIEEVIIFGLDLCVIFIIGYNFFTYFFIEKKEDQSNVFSKLMIIFIIITIIFAFFSIISCLNIEKVFSKETDILKETINFSMFRGVLFLSVLFIFLLALLFWFNFSDFRFSLFYLSFFLLILIIIIAITSGFIYKNANKISKFYENNHNCYAVLKNIHESIFHNKLKYLETSESPYLTCNSNMQDIIWERTPKYQKNACLNMECCDFLNKLYTATVIKVYLMNLGVGISAFFVIFISLFLSTLKNTLINTRKYILIFIFLCFLVLSLFMILYYPYEEIKRRENYLNEIKNFNFDESITEEDITASGINERCFLISQKLARPYDPILLNSDSEVRSIFSVLNAKLYYRKNINDEKIKIFDNRNPDKIFNSYDGDNENFLIVEGELNAMKQFVNKEVWVCPGDILARIEIIYENTEIVKHRILENNNQHKEIFQTLQIEQFESSNYQYYEGIVLDIQYKGIKNTDICLTNVNAELGQNFICYVNTKTDENGKFNLKISQIVTSNYAYILFSHSEYYSLQYEFSFEVNKKQKYNLGYFFLNKLKSTPLMKSPTILSHNLKLTQKSHKITIDIADLQNDLDIKFFSNQKILITNVFLDEGIANVTAKLYSFSTLICKADIEISTGLKPLTTIISDKDGFITFYNLEYGSYTIYLSHPNYKTNCIPIDIIKNYQYNKVALVPNFEKDKIVVIITWMDPKLLLGLYASFYQETEKNKCLIGYQNNYCGEVKLTFRNNTKNGNVLSQILEINLRKYNYLIFAKQSISKDEKIDYEKNSKTLNFESLYSNAQIRYYVEEVDFPVIFSNNFKVPKEEHIHSVLNEENMAYLIACVQPNKYSNKPIILKNLFWIKKLYSKEGKEFPEADICLNL